jgi:hypothetical protein
MFFEIHCRSTQTAHHAPFSAGALFGAAVDWLQRGCVRTPAEEATWTWQLPCPPTVSARAGTMATDDREWAETSRFWQDHAQPKPMSFVLSGRAHYRVEAFGQGRARSAGLLGADPVSAASVSAEGGAVSSATRPSRRALTCTA